MTRCSFPSNTLDKSAECKGPIKFYRSDGSVVFTRCEKHPLQPYFLNIFTEITEQEYESTLMLTELEPGEISGSAGYLEMREAPIGKAEPRN